MDVIHRDVKLFIFVAFKCVCYAGNGKVGVKKTLCIPPYFWQEIRVCACNSMK